MSRTKWKQTGDRGEAFAADYLRRNGYTIRDQNWHCRTGEIDIIAEVDGQIVFVEVRTRHADTTESAFASISPKKIERLLSAVYAYLEANTIEEEAIWRVDVIAIALPKGRPPLINHAENALGW